MSPRVREDSVHPRLQSGAIARPLNFTVRRRINMKPSQAFGVVVRVIGLLGWLGAFFYLLSAVVVLAVPSYRPGVRPWWHYLISAAVLFLVGWFLMRRAERLVTFAYRSSSSDAPDA